MQDEDDVERVVATVVGEHGRIDILVNNAGIGRLEGIDTETLDGWNDVLATNLTAPFSLLRRAAEHLKASSGASVVNIGLTAQFGLS